MVSGRRVSHLRVLRLVRGLGMSLSHVVLNLTEDEAKELGHLLDRVDGHALSASESGTKKKILLALNKRGLRVSGKTEQGD